MMPTVEIKSSGSHYCVFLEVHDDSGQQIGIYQPFSEQCIQTAIVLDSERVGCLGDKGGIVVIHIPEGLPVAEAKVPCGINMKLVHLKSNKLLAIWGTHVIFFFDANDLSHKGAFDAVHWHGEQGQLVDSKFFTVDNHERQSLRSTKDLRSLDLAGFIVDTPSGDITAGYFLNELRSYDRSKPETLEAARKSAQYLDDPARRFGIYRIEPATGTISRVEIDKVYDYPAFDHIKWISPCGRYGLRVHMSELEMHEPSNILTRWLSGPRQVNTHRDCLNDGQRRFAIKLDLWSLWPVELERTLPLAWLPPLAPESETLLTAVATQTKDNRSGFGFDNNLAVREDLRQETDAQVRSWVEFLNLLFGKYSNELCWEQTGEAFWIKTRGGLVRRVSLDGQVSPFLKFERLSHDGSRDVDANKLPFRLIEIMGPLKEVCLEADRIVIQFREHTFHISTDILSAAGHKVVIPMEHDGYMAYVGKSKISDLSSEDVAHLSTHQLTLSELTEAAAERALTELTQEIKGDFKHLLKGSSLSRTFELGFVTPEGILGEHRFFAMAREEGWGLTAELQDVLNAYLEALASERGRWGWPEIWGPHYEEGGYAIGALGLALHHLVIVDRDAIPTFRLYLSRRDGEHEIYSADVVMKDYVETHGYFNQEAFRLGIYWVLIRYRDGLGLVDFLWNGLHLLDAAKEKLSPDEFVQLLLEETNCFDEDWQWDHQNTDEIYSSLIRILPQYAAWGERTEALLHQVREAET